MSKSPIFPIAEPHHFSDYGFDPQLSYFQVLEEAKRHAKRGIDTKPCLDSIHIKLQKPPISKDDSRSNSKRTNQKHRRASAKKWLRSAGSALVFWKRSKREHSHSRSYSRHAYSASYPTCYSSSYSASGPLYMTEGYSSSCRVKSGPLAVPYFNLRQLNLTSGSQSGSSVAGALPVYLVT